MAEAGVGRRVVVGNWKMNGVASDLDEADRIAQAVEAAGVQVRVGLCPPATLINRMAARLAGAAVEVGGQDCRAETSGAYTGDVSAAMLADAGARLVILGHSERRQGHGETDALVAAKVDAALAAGLEPIVCVGETLAEREAGQATAVVARQVRASLPASLGGRTFCVAYEPVWAIGTGLIPTMEEIGAVHGEIRRLLRELFSNGDQTPILYGGSVKASNAAEIFAVADVDGALVGGASLTAKDFVPIVQAAA